MHYLASVKNIEIEGKPLSFRELPGGGDIYFPAFQNNAIRPIKERFGENPMELLEAGKRLGGKQIDKGDAAVEISVFPKIPVTVMSGGVNVAGACIPLSGGIVIDLHRMDRIIEINTDSGYAIIEPGVNFSRFTSALAECRKNYLLYQANCRKTAEELFTLKMEQFLGDLSKNGQTS